MMSRLLPVTSRSSPTPPILVSHSRYPAGSKGKVGWRGPFDTLDTDWAPKAEVLFTSLRPFAWTQADDSDRAEAAALQWDSDASFYSSGVQFFARLRHWAFPGTPLAPSYLTKLERLTATSSSQAAATPLTKEDKEDLAYHEVLTREWQAAFTSLQACFLKGSDRYFYFFAPRYTILFRHRTSGPVATVTRSTKGLRGALKDHGVDFQMPLYYTEESDLPEQEQYETEESKEERRETLEDLQFFSSLNRRKT